MIEIRASRHIPYGDRQQAATASAVNTATCEANLSSQSDAVSKHYEGIADYTYPYDRIQAFSGSCAATLAAAHPL